MSNFYGSFFTLIFAVLLVIKKLEAAPIKGQILYETRVLDNTYLSFKVQLPTSNSIEITGWS